MASVSYLYDGGTFVITSWCTFPAVQASPVVFLQLPCFCSSQTVYDILMMCFGSGNDCWHSVPLAESYSGTFHSTETDTPLHALECTVLKIICSSETCVHDWNTLNPFNSLLNTTACTLPASSRSMQVCYKTPWSYKLQMRTGCEIIYTRLWNCFHVISVSFYIYRPCIFVLYFTK